METKKIERTMVFRFKIPRVPSKNISSVRSPTLKEKLVRQNSSGERRLKEDIRSDIRRPGPR
jgi:hypothetical protein